MRRAIADMVVIITGASAGIGRALAEQLSGRGARLVLAARRVDRLEALNITLGGKHLIIPTDVACPDQCAALVSRAVERFGRIDTLVCNAGYGILRAVGETTREEFQALLATNVLGTTDCIRAALPILLRQEVRAGWRGQVMIVSSALARRGLPFFGGYSATKAAQLSISEAMRVELKDQHIAVTSVHPIGTDTEFSEVSAQQSAGLRPETRGEVRQSAQAVAQAMLRGIEWPRAEVWPFFPSRWALGLGTLFPSLVDRALSRRVLVANPATKDQVP